MTQFVKECLELAGALGCILSFGYWFTREPAASKEIREVVEAYKVTPLIEDTYWRPMVENNAKNIARDLDVSVYLTGMTENVARDLYLRWCEKIEKQARAKTQEPVKALIEKEEPLKATFSKPNYNAELSRAMTQAINLKTFVDFDALSKPTFDAPKVWVYNVSRQTLITNHATLGEVKIPGNMTRKRYALYTSFPGVVSLPSHNLNENSIGASYVDGRRFVMDLINPDNFGLDQNKEMKVATSIGRNFSEMGVFWSLSNPPKKEEVSAAVQRMAKRYNILLEKITELYLGSLPDMRAAKALMKENRKERKKDKEIPELTLEEAYEQSRLWVFEGFLTPEHHFAADYYNLITPWHPYKGCGTQG